ncbi:MAG: TlpA family protein disulfide reductase, partial [Solirubrobacteraceae bacterium]
VSRPSLRSAALLILPAAALAIGACGADEPGAQRPAATVRPASEITSPELRKISEQANQILDGGPDAFRARLADLRGHPVVVNQWGSWCGPCRFEFPFFQRQAAKYGDRVAFLGVDMQDSREAAADFLREQPVPYPHYFDPDTSIARLFRGGRVSPTTAFYDAQGKLLYAHLGAYPDEEQLEREIRRYALNG